MKYSEIENQSWGKVIRQNERKWRSPYSAHIPLHPPFSDCFTYADCAFNVYTLPLVPLSLYECDRHGELIDGIETMILQFAFDDPAFVPDFRLTRVELENGYLPVVNISCYAWDMLYEIKYYCESIGEKDYIICVDGTVTNDSIMERPAIVRAKLNFQNEKKLFDYHYKPFHWDASNWKKDDSVSFSDGKLIRNNLPVASVFGQDFDVDWEKETRFKAKDYNTRFGCQRPYFVRPEMMLKKLDNLIRFSAILQPQEQKRFSLRLGTKEKAIKSPKRTISRFKSFIDNDNISQLHMAPHKMGDIFRTLQISTLQLLIDFDKIQGLQPCQGGTSERFHVWVWEAMCMLSPMIRLGHFNAVKKVIDFIFTLQDGGFPPVGEFNSLDGAIGTTGPRWMSTTGAALALSTDYYRYSHDENFIHSYLPKMLRAAFWIINEIRHSRIPNSPVHGLMPYGKATDADIGYVLSMSDAYSYFGLEKFSRLLSSINHEKTDEVLAEVRQYKKDISDAIDRVRRGDGFIDRKIVPPDRPQNKTERKFENVVGIQSMSWTGALPTQDERFRDYLHYCEENIFHECFTGFMDRDVMYVGFSEHIWHDAYLKLGHWKKAYTMLRTNLNYGMTNDAHLVQERFSLTDPSFIPWQPNGSGNGRMLDMITKQFYFEYEDAKHGETMLFFGGIPSDFFMDNEELSLVGFYTPAGRIDVRVKRKVFKITSEGFSFKDKVLRFPEYLRVSFESKSLESLNNSFYKSDKNIHTLSGIFNF